MLSTNFSNPNRPRILLADDQQDVLEALRLLLKGEGFATETVNSPAAVLSALSSPQEREFDLMLMDMNYTRDTTSGLEGLELIEQVRRLDDTLPVVVMTAWGSIELAVESMREGGCDFIQKPWDNDRLLSVLHAQLERGRKLRQAKQERLAYERFQRFEFEEARRIQESLLPTRLPKIEGLDIAAAWQPMREVSGDYFDVIKLGEGKIAVCLADVEGKGLPAAMLMSNLQAAVRSLASQALPPGEMVERLNRTMLQNSSGQKLITLFYAVIDVPNVTMSYVNAGHLPPLLVHGDGSYRQLSTGGAMLHIFADSTFEAAELRLMPGDRLLIFTDGVVECTNAAGDEFGEASLLQCLREGRADDAEGLLQRVKRSVTQFSGGEFQDDLTMLALGYGTVIFP